MVDIERLHAELTYASVEFAYFLFFKSVCFCHGYHFEHFSDLRRHFLVFAPENGVLCAELLSEKVHYKYFGGHYSGEKQRDYPAFVGDDAYVDKEHHNVRRNVFDYLRVQKFDGFYIAYEFRLNASRFNLLVIGD